MSNLPRTGNADPCPQDPEHGRMWMFATGRQYCPAVRHVGPSLYENDGLTVAHLRGADMPAADLRRAARVAVR